MRIGREALEEAASNIERSLPKRILKFVSEHPGLTIGCAGEVTGLLCVIGFTVGVNLGYYLCNQQQEDQNAANPTEPAVAPKEEVVAPSPSPEAPPTPVPEPSPELPPTEALPAEIQPTEMPPTQELPSTPIVDTETLPSEVIDLRIWKLTLPTGPADHATEVLQPQLSSFSEDPWFVVVRTDGQSGIRFRAPVTGSTTSGSEYPRCELREMNPDGSKAAWSSSEGTHIMTVDLTITALPKEKQHIVVAQIHGTEDDIVQIRLEGTNLKVDINGKDGPVLDVNYVLGTRFTVKLEVSGGRTIVHYIVDGKGTVTEDITDFIARETGSSSYSGAYFKAGAYTASNCDKMGKGNKPEPCDPTNYGEIDLWFIDVSHY